MKVKQYVVITNSERFLKGSLNCFGLYANTKYLPDEWTVAGEVEFEIDVDTKEILNKATAELDAEMGKLTAAMNVLEQRKSELLAITYQPEEES